MSDFDKEAEREKLQEKYEADQESREVAERMSELLLQGATMTNAHCSDCGDPIFRYDGQEFCATCEKPVDRGTDDGADTDDEVDGDATDDDAAGEGRSDGSDRIEVTTPSDDARVAFGEAAGGDDPTDSGAGEEPTPDASGTAKPSEPPVESQSGVDQVRQGDERDGARPSTERTASPPGGMAAGPARPAGSTDPAAGGAEADLAAARQSLVRTLVRFSQRAEATDDPARAREHLATAREAAEALSALRR
jgi:uncharacterized Zn finger protein (UPF0148 family)